MLSSSTYRSVRKRVRPGSRQRRSKEKQSQECTAPICANGFLKQPFLPVTDSVLPSIKQVLAIEKDFFNSLDNLSHLYGFEPMDTRGYVFPHNIYTAHAHAETIIKQYDKGLHLLIVNDEKHIATLTTVKEADTGGILYYIPVEPLLFLLRQKTRKQTKELMLSVYAYLYQVVKMPFCDSSSFMGYQYEMLQEWIEQEPEAWDEAEYKEKLADIKALFRYSNHIKKHISKPRHLEQFSARIKRFTPASLAEKILLEVAVKLCGLWAAYPARSFFDSITDNFLQPDIEERMQANQYFSFYWSNNGWLYEDVMENINVSLQEMQVAEEPIALQYFETPQSEVKHDLNFQTTLLEIICELAEVLNDF